MNKIFLPFYLIFSVVLPHLAHAENQSSGDPLWFPLFEVGGVVVTIFALISVRRVLGAVGGHLGSQFRCIQGALLLMLFAFAFRAFVEFNEFEGLVYEIAFELPLYGAAIMMAYSTKKLSSLLSGK